MDGAQKHSAEQIKSITKRIHTIVLLQSTKEEKLIFTAGNGDCSHHRKKVLTERRYGSLLNASMGLLSFNRKYIERNWRNEFAILQITTHWPSFWSSSLRCLVYPFWLAVGEEVRTVRRAATTQRSKTVRKNTSVTEESVFPTSSIWHAICSIYQRSFAVCSEGHFFAGGE